VRAASRSAQRRPQLFHGREVSPPRTPSEGQRKNATPRVKMSSRSGRDFELHDVPSSVSEASPKSISVRFIARMTTRLHPRAVKKRAYGPAANCSPSPDARGAFGRVFLTTLEIRIGDFRDVARFELLYGFLCSESSSLMYDASKSRSISLRARRGLGLSFPTTAAARGLCQRER